LNVTTKNEPVWHLARAHGLSVKVDIGQAVANPIRIGVVDGVDKTPMTDTDGNPTSTVWLQTHDHGLLGVAEACRILSYGPSCWKNLVAWHVFDASEQAAAKQGWQPSAYFAGAQQNVLVGDELSLDTNQDRLKEALARCGGGTTYAEFVDGVQNRNVSKVPSLSWVGRRGF
jgi:hypothetical protein